MGLVSHKYKKHLGDLLWPVHRGLLEPVWSKKQQKISSWPVTGLWNRGPLKDLNDSKLMSPSVYPDHPGSLLYHSKSSGVPYSTSQYLARNFFCCFLLQAGSSSSLCTGHNKSPRCFLYLWLTNPMFIFQVSYHTCMEFRHLQQFP